MEGLEALDVTELSQAKVGISPCDILQSSSVSDDRPQWVQQCYCMLISPEKFWKTKPLLVDSSAHL